MIKQKQQKEGSAIFICVLFFILFFLLPLPVQGEETVIVTTKVLNVRSGPAITYDRVGQVISGQQLTVVEEKNGWLRIKMDNKNFGWVIKDYVSLKPLQLLINGTIVNVRSGPGTNFSKVTTLAKGTKVTAINFQKDWYQIKYSAGTGWVAQWLVEKNESGEVMPSSASKPLTKTGDNSRTDILEENKGISWTWQKTSRGIKIAFRGNEPLGYSEKITAGEPHITLEFGGPWQNPGEIKEINFGGINKITTGQGTMGTLFQVDLERELPYETILSNDGCLLNLNIVCDVQEDKRKEKVVLIDPGHGSFNEKGYDPGAVGSGGLKESDIVLDIGIRIEKLLTEKGVNVIMTRDQESSLTLEDRAGIANELFADVFVSIHVNSSVSSTLNGTTTYYYAPFGTDLEAQRGMRRSLAESVHNKMLAYLDRKNLGIREQNFAVLRYTQVPSILVETAFISNPSEEKLLANDQFRVKAAQAIAEGIWEFLER